MTIDEAIENSKEATVYLAIHHQPRLAEGLRLGIEALDYLIRERIANPGVAYTILPGETQE